MRLVWEGMVEANRLSRYYGYLAHRLKHLGELLSIIAVCSSLAALFTIVSPLPKWVPLTALGITIVASIVSAINRFEHKAACSGDLCRQIGRLSTDWHDLLTGFDGHDEAELRNSWRNLSQQQQDLVERSQIELPLSRSLSRRSQNEANEYWCEFARNFKAAP